MRGDIPAQDAGRASGPHCGAGGCGERPGTGGQPGLPGCQGLKELMGRSGCSTGAPWWAWSWVSFMCCRSSTLYISLSTCDLCRAGWAPQVSMSMIVTMQCWHYCTVSKTWLSSMRGIMWRWRTSDRSSRAPSSSISQELYPGALSWSVMKNDLVHLAP